MRADVCACVRSNHCLYFDYRSNKRPTTTSTTSTEKSCLKEVAQTKIYGRSIIVIG